MLKSLKPFILLESVLQNMKHGNEKVNLQPIVRDRNNKRQLWNRDETSTQADHISLNPPFLLDEFKVPNKGDLTLRKYSEFALHPP